MEEKGREGKGREEKGLKRVDRIRCSNAALYSTIQHHTTLPWHDTESRIWGREKINSKAKAKADEGRMAKRWQKDERKMGKKTGIRWEKAGDDAKRCN